MSESGNIRARPNSHGSSRFRHSLQLIPTPDVDVKRPPRVISFYIRWKTVSVLSALSIGLAIGVQVALSISLKNNGFNVPSLTTSSLSSLQFILSFVPALTILPLGYMYRRMDSSLRLIYPYVVLSQGNATAEHSIMLDYTSLRRRRSLLYSIKFRHFIVFFSASAAVGTFGLQSLTSGLLTIIYAPQVKGTSVTGITTVGFVQNSIDQLDPFVAAAGYANAAAFHGLGDPPFVKDGWTVAEFQIPSNTTALGASIDVETVGALTSQNCVGPSLPPFISVSGNNLTLTASSSVSLCNVSVSIDAARTITNEKYGAVDVNCRERAAQDIRFRPVMFWYLHNRDDNGKPEARTIFCHPEVNVYNVRANVSLSDKSLQNVTVINNYIQTTTSTDPPFGPALNGVIFPPTTVEIVAARALSINSGLSGSIFRLASKSGVQEAFDLEDGFLGPTNDVYAQHLSIVAKSLYFVPSTSVIQGQLRSLVPRLWVNPFGAGVFSVLLLLITGIGIATQIHHYRTRKDLYFTVQPGSIASIVALTSRSGFGNLLLPYDDEETIRRKLKGLRFRLDERTGAILADDDELEENGVGADIDRDADLTASLLPYAQIAVEKALGKSAVD